MLSIASWNCQGNPIEEPLATGFLQELLTDHDIVVLQSCGTLVGSSVEAVKSVTVGRIRCSIRGASQPISVDPFCCTAILSRLGSDHPLSGGTVLEIGVAGRFGVACDVLFEGGNLVVAALHAAPHAFDAKEAECFVRMLQDRAGTDPVLIAARIGGDVVPVWQALARPGTNASIVTLLDNRRIAHPSPGGWHDSFLALRLVQATGGTRGVIDSAGASDHDAVHAAFSLQAATVDPILHGSPGR